MLLTNQKTINYENLHKNLKGTTPPCFSSAKVLYVLRYFLNKIHFNINFTKKHIK